MRQIDNFNLSVKSVKFGRWEEKEIVAKRLEKLGSMDEIVHDLPHAKIELLLTTYLLVCLMCFILKKEKMYSPVFNGFIVKI